MFLEAVIVSINYADFLRYTLKNNKKFFDYIVVVTDTKDTETQKVCKENGVHCISTDDVYENGSTIPNKGIAINKGLDVLTKKDWVLQMDADIWLPPLTREILNRKTLDIKKLYGTDRFMCNSYKEWINFLDKTSETIASGWIYLHTNIFPIGTRVVQYKGEGYWPIGFFQLWNPSGSGIKTYPTEHEGYDRTDVVHLKQWAPQHRGFIPDFICFHLASENHKQGQNWRGRNTAKFGPVKNKTFKEKIMKIFLNVWKYLVLLFTRKKSY